MELYSCKTKIILGENEVMHKFFTPKELINGDVAKIIGDDVKHIYKVLRISEGER